MQQALQYGQNDDFIRVWPVGHFVAFRLGVGLHRNGFIYRKPIGILHKFSAEAQQVFVENYNELKQKTGNDESILFIDCVPPDTGNKTCI